MTSRPNRSSAASLRHAVTHGLTRRLTRALVALLFASSSFAQSTLAPAGRPDEPDARIQRPAVADRPATFAEALSRWRSPEAIDHWLGANFVYDPRRAQDLSETARSAGASTPVMEPQAFFADPRGVCVDMARFAVTVLREVDPQARAAYLMLEFEPVRVSGHVYRRHWMATFQREGLFYFFADSRRPGHTAGPYESVDAFVADYGEYRGRAVVSYKVLDHYARRLRTRAPRSLRDERG